MSANYGTFPAIANTISQTITGSSAAIAGIKAGVRYRVITSTACNLSMGVTATLTSGLYLAANAEYYFMFGMYDSQGVQPDIRVIGTSGQVYFTPVISVVGG